MFLRCGGPDQDPQGVATMGIMGTFRKVGRQRFNVGFQCIREFFTIKINSPDHPSGGRFSMREIDPEHQIEQFGPLFQNCNKIVCMSPSIAFFSNADQFRIQFGICHLNPKSKIQIPIPIPIPNLSAPSTFHLPPTTYYLLPTTCYLLPATYYLLPLTHPPISLQPGFFPYIRMPVR